MKEKLTEIYHTIRDAIFNLLSSLFEGCKGLTKGIYANRYLIATFLIPLIVILLVPKKILLWIIGGTIVLIIALLYILFRKEKGGDLAQPAPTANASSATPPTPPKASSACATATTEPAKEWTFWTATKHLLAILIWTFLLFQAYRERVLIVNGFRSCVSSISKYLPAKGNISTNVNKLQTLPKNDKFKWIYNYDRLDVYEEGDFEPEKRTDVFYAKIVKWNEKQIAIDIYDKMGIKCVCSLKWDKNKNPSYGEYHQPEPKIDGIWHTVGVGNPYNGDVIKGQVKDLKSSAWIDIYFRRIR